MMQRSNSFKQSLLGHMLVGLRLGGAWGRFGKVVSTTDAILVERKEAVKVSADVAMALARGGARWSNALISNIYGGGKEKNKLVVRSMVGCSRFQKLRFQRLVAKLQQCRRGPTRRRMVENKKILKRILRRRKTWSNNTTIINHDRNAKCVAKNITKKRLFVLKSLVPGGQAMDDELFFLGETIDYIISLRAQVDVMRSLARSVDSKSSLPTMLSCSRSGESVDRG
ncbi:hypothetical protein ZOSMA_43G00280 [Zostera marina]|uniref:IBH1-like N-terminal domain-containing protein n=1 Tax=Zostera marina TaxID=29655 RepID=A0A0K9P1B3_ZOSMR|nr:hypothetical protein ZOSMA_43G00280 [Zostera marina]